MVKEKELLEEVKKMLSANGSDCPADLIKMARTKWQKTVAIEFLHLYKETLEIKTNQKWLKWLIVSVFGLSVLGVLSQWMPHIFRLFGL